MTMAFLGAYGKTLSERSWEYGCLGTLLSEHKAQASHLTPETQLVDNQGHREMY